jgi:catechol 2,3-dioxygenase-like lactoylglutathione lyase family enzyme
MPRLLVNVDVPDLEAGIRFYTRALGLTIGRRFGAAGVELLGADTPIYLLAAPAGSAPFPGAAQHRDYARHWTPVHLDLAVDDLGAAVARAVDAGARVEVPAARHAWGDLAVLADPFGHGLCLLRFEGRGYDAIATGGGEAPASA